jgi:hypothetical protein
VNGTISAGEYGTVKAQQTCDVSEAVADTTVTLVPPDPVQGEDVTVWYVSTNGPLEDAAQVYLKYGFNGWEAPLPDDVLMAATNGLTGSEYKATITLANDALQLDVSLNDGVSIVDDNNGQDWHFVVGRPPAGDPVTIDPNPAQAGQQVLITYNPVGRVLEGLDNVNIHYGFNSWNPVQPDEPMTFTADCTWQVTVDVAPFASGPEGLNMVFFSGGTWDNNDENNWNFEVFNEAGDPPWVMDGYLDPCAQELGVSSSGNVHLWAGLQDGFLYVATERSPGTPAEDHFIFIAESPGGLASQPWGKQGLIAQWDVFLAQEADNGWNGWTGMGPTTNRSNSPQSLDLPILEGQFDLAEEMGGMIPTTISIAVGAWPTADNTVMIPADQVLPGNGDGNIDANEYAVAATLDLQVTGGPYDPADFDCDGDVDLDDYEIFESCLRDPGDDIPAACIVNCDLNDDGEVNLRDFADYQVVFTGEPS